MHLYMSVDKRIVFCFVCQLPVCALGFWVKPHETAQLRTRGCSLSLNISVVSLVLL